MKKAARRLAAVSSVLATMGFAAGVIDGCAAGSDESQVDAAIAASDTGPASDVSTDSQGDAASIHDTSAPPDTTPGVDAADGGSVDGDTPDAADAADSADAADTHDAAPTVIFGETCPTGTVYTESFLTDPVADGTLLPLIGTYTYGSSGHTLSLAAGNPNAQMWIGARPQWTNYTISVPIRIDSATSSGNGGITFRMEATPTAPANNAGQMYFAGIGTGQVVLGIENGNWTEFVGPSATFALNTYYTLQVTVNGSAISVSVNGTAYATSYVDPTYAFGSIGLRTFAAGMTYGAITVTCN